MVPTGFDKQNGLTYVEVLLAVLIIAVCVAPAMQAINSGLSSHAPIRSVNTFQLCVQQALEKTAAELFSNLLPAAISKVDASGKFTNPTSYSLPVSASCPQPVNVYILRYDPRLANPFSATFDEMLYLRAEISGGPSHGTLAIRR